MTIRMLGGLLSAHYLSTTFPQLAPLTDDDPNQPGEDLYIEKAADLADRILGAFDSQSGVPFASINLNTSEGVPSKSDGGASSTAEAATLQLEFKYLAKLTGEAHFWESVEKVIQVIDGQHREDGLLPIFINANTGQFRGENIRLGSRGDSYYEYLIKQYLQTSQSEPVYLEMWNEALEGIKKHLLTYSKHASLTVLGERPQGLHKPLSPKMDHLVCFMPGTIALAVTGGQSVAEAKTRLGSDWTSKQDQDLHLAKELMKTCWGMYKATATGLAPEIAHFKIDDPPRPWTAGPAAPAASLVSHAFDDPNNTLWRQDY
jgi:mannosyl-oligosaccharide alpha-1,2-mannosidase